MLTAIIYIRVSTDEQAQKGYSQRNQEEKLKKYCKHNRRYFKIELDKGNKISTQKAVKTLSFLKRLREFCISKKME